VSGEVAVGEIDRYTFAASAGDVTLLRGEATSGDLSLYSRGVRN
jgi:hypothetical protein